MTKKKIKRDNEEKAGTKPNTGGQGSDETKHQVKEKQKRLCRENQTRPPNQKRGMRRKNLLAMLGGSALQKREEKMRGG